MDTRYSIDIALENTANEDNPLLISGYGEQGVTLKLLSYKANDSGEFIFNTQFEDAIPNASFCAIDGDLIFTLEEHDDSSKVHMYKKANGRYSLVDSKTLEGNGLCHIAYHPENRLLMGAFYLTGNIFCLPVTEFGFLEPTVNLYQGKTEGLTGKAHCTYLSPDKRHMYSANIEQDRIYKYIIIDNFIVLDHYLTLIKGTGPRHIIESNGILYVMTEYSNEVVVIDNQRDKMKVIQRISTLFDGYDKTSYGSTLVMTVDRQNLYAANRGADTIAMFSLTPDGLLVESGYYSTIGKNPRHISLFNHDKTLAIACQDSDRIYLYNRDVNTGVLTPSNSYIDHKTPSYC